MRKVICTLFITVYVLNSFAFSGKRHYTVFPVIPEKLFQEDTIRLLPEIDSRSSLSDIYAWNNPERTKKYYWRSAVQVFGLNMAVWGFNRYVANEEFARISMKTIRDNIKHGFVWDNDQFSTNLFAHPYHGNLYFNLARSNGMTFFQSIPYTIGGSLMWEVAMENEPPAINDFIATPIGGIALGEVTHRISQLLLDDSKRGGARFWREFAATLVNPMQGLNRLITGEAWKVRNKYYKYHDFEDIPVKFSMSISDRYLADNNYLFRGANNMQVEFNLKYGDPLDEDSGKPYDYFDFHIGFNAIGNQPFINEISLVAKLLGRQVEPLPGHRMFIGLFQHFDFFDSEAVVDDSELPPFKIAEAAAVGFGMVYDLPSRNKRINIRQSTYVNAVLLGGSISDHYKVIDRNYNMGSGFSFKCSTEIKMSNYADFILNVQYYQIYTWKGKHPDELKGNPIYYNVQGDKGNASLTVINPSFGFNILPKLRFQTSLTYYLRDTNYKYYDDVSFKTFETRVGLLYEF